MYGGYNYDNICTASVSVGYDDGCTYIYSVYCIIAHSKTMHYK